MTCVISVVQNAFETISINSDYYPVKTDVKKKKNSISGNFLYLTKIHFYMNSSICVIKNVGMSRRSNVVKFIIDI